MNTPWVIVSDNAFVHIANYIWEKLAQSYKKSFDIFFELVSSTVWQSPRELAKNWILYIAPNEWKLLQDLPHDTIDIRRKKESVRKWLLMEISLALGKIWMHPTFIQRISTRLLVRDILAYDLPTHDQDRVITAELMTTLKLWRSLLSMITIHDIASDEQPLTEMPFFSINEKGEDTTNITVEGHIEPLDSLPELSITHAVGEKSLIDWTTIRIDVSRILVSQDILRRHEDMISPPKKEYKIRSATITGLGGIPVFKKRSFGNGPSKEEPEWAWQATPA